MLSVPARLAHVATDDGAVFLDIETDRYFRLPPHLERPFAEALAGRPVDHGQADRLVALGVLELAPNAGPARPTAVIRVADSIVDSATPGRVRLAAVAAATGSVLRARRSLNRGLANTLDAIAANPARLGASRDKASLRRATLAFLAARRFIPVRPVCLLDSVAMLDYLSRRGLDADLVFGVIVRPFSAHCWLQVGDLALNDEFDNLVGRAPILVV